MLEGYPCKRINARDLRARVNMPPGGFLLQVALLAGPGRMPSISRRQDQTGGRPAFGGITRLDHNGVDSFLRGNDPRVSRLGRFSSFGSFSRSSSKDQRLKPSDRGNLQSLY